MSHLHKVHAGGITLTDDRTGERFISFPYATYYVQKREFDFAMEAGNASYISEDFSLLQDFSRVDWLTNDEGWIGDHIHYQLTGAHSKFHQVFSIISDRGTVFFGGDDAPQLQQMKNRFVAKYDYDGKKCMELRQQWWQEGQEKGWTFLFYHDIKTPVWGENNSLPCLLLLRCFLNPALCCNSFFTTWLPGPRRSSRRRNRACFRHLA